MTSSPQFPNLIHTDFWFIAQNAAFKVRKDIRNCSAIFLLCLSLCHSRYPFNRHLESTKKGMQWRGTRGSILSMDVPIGFSKRPILFPEWVVRLLSDLFFLLRES